MRYDFIYNNAPAYLLFDDALGSLSEIWYFDKGALTCRVVEEFAFNEARLQLRVEGKVTIFYNDAVTMIKGPDIFKFDATSQESLEYFTNHPSPEKIKRMQVNGTAIEYLKMILFDPETGVFSPMELPAPAPEPLPAQPE